MRKEAIFVLLVTCCLQVNAQFVNWGSHNLFSQRYLDIDSNSVWNECCCINGDLKPILAFDTRYSPDPNQSGFVKINGFKIGLELFKKVRYGFGFYKLDVPFRLEPVLTENGFIDRRMRFRYASFFLDYVVYENRKWEFSVPLAYGRGRGFLEQRMRSNGMLLEENRKNISLLAVNLSIQYKFTSWFGIGTGIGYRQSFVKEDELKEYLNAPFYMVRLKIFLGPIVKWAIDPEKMREEKEEYREEKKRKREDRRKK